MSPPPPSPPTAAPTAVTVVQHSMTGVTVARRRLLDAAGRQLLVTDDELFDLADSATPSDTNTIEQGAPFVIHSTYS
eukprot:1038855-Prorocentrum_minimum.AAC.1